LLQAGFRHREFPEIDIIKKSESGVEKILKRLETTKKYLDTSKNSTSRILGSHTILRLNLEKAINEINNIIENI
jgi:hypothetical protein